MATNAFSNDSLAPANAAARNTFRDFSHTGAASSERDTLRGQSGPSDKTAPVTFLILGAGGDLTKRLLLPGLASLLAVEPERQVHVVGADRAQLGDDGFRDIVRTAFETAKCAPEATERIAGDARYVTADLLAPSQLKKLIDSCEGELVLYFALPPAITMKVCAELEKMTLPPSTRLGLEKPFGSDEGSAHDFNEQLRRVVPEERIFRVDHFLGVSTVLNIIGMRFANRILQGVWSGDHIERVEIVYDEDLALEGRAGYYDKAGALRDMLQSHLLQVMAIFAMEPIASLDARELSALKEQVLRATHLWADDPVASSKRARYTSGDINGRQVPAYVDEEGVDPARETETLAQMTVEVRNNRWTGVPIVLRSGKGIGAPHKQIICYFRATPHIPDGFTDVPAGPDKLIIGLKPGTVSLELTMNAEGDPLGMERKSLSAHLAEAHMTAYGEVLRYVLDNNQLLSVSGEAAELCWHIVSPVLEAFAQGKVPLEEYPAGSFGPDGWLPADSPALSAAYADASSDVPAGVNSTSPKAD